MARYRIGFSEEAYGYYYFDADSLEQAQDLIDKVDDGEMDITELPNVYRKENNGEHDWLSDVEEAK
jgi:hypothetical protein